MDKLEKSEGIDMRKLIRIISWVLLSLSLIVLLISGMDLIQDSDKAGLFAYLIGIPFIPVFMLSSLMLYITK